MAVREPAGLAGAARKYFEPNSDDIDVPHFIIGDWGEPPPLLSRGCVPGRVGERPQGAAADDRRLKADGSHGRAAQ